ncbi:MAG TPA: PA0069 family radical SAM protein, partial [Haliangium sp.]|nr:PA0069 family radical SAM protein [Haliangium sp.]
AAFDDGWGSLDEPVPALETQVTVEKTRNILTRNDSPDIPFDRSINPYKGCEHGCVYCFARPTHAYLGLSPGLDFESKLVAKPDAAASLRAELARPSYRCEVIALGANTDPYQPIERQWRIARAVLEVLREARHPVSIVTKSSLVLRDIDILSEMASRNLASVFLSITTLDRALARRMEPRAATPERRLDAVRELSAAGVPVGVLVSPVIPALNDVDMERVLTAAAEAGARAAHYILVRLPLEIKDLFSEWLDTHYPDRAERVRNLIRDTRGGKLYDSRFGTRMRGEGAFAELIARRFQVAAHRLGLDRGMSPLDCSQFQRPPGKETAKRPDASTTSDTASKDDTSKTGNDTPPRQLDLFR